MKSKVLSFLMVTLLSMMALPAAGSSYYSKVTVNASGAGKVYVANAKANSPAYNATATATNSSTSQDAPTHTYYLYAQAEEGHEFKGWYTDEACSKKADDVTEDNGTYTAKVKAESTTQGSPTTKIYYALFAEIGAPTITCEKSRMYINVGDEPIANDGVTAENCTPTYTSSNEAVATVDADGKVSAVGAGSAYITASAPGAIDAKYIVTVLDYTEAGKIQIGNGNFEDWTNVTDNNHAPNNWNSFETAEGSLATMAKAKQVSMVEDNRPGSNGLYCVEIHSRNVIGNTNAQGNLTLGCINAGHMTPTHKDNHNFTKTEDVNKSETISKIPTAMKVWVKFVPNDNSYEARVAATIHDKFNYITYGQATVDTDSNKEHVVASAEQNFTACGWTELTLPFTLSGNAVLNDQLYIVVNFTTNATPGKGSSKDYLYIDDIELVYDTDYDKVPVKVSDAQYSTFVAPFKVKMPAAITASTVETVGNTYETMLDLKAVADSTVEANTPVILNASTAQDRIAYGVAAPETAEFGLLTGVYEDTPALQGTYVLQNQAAGVGFYKVETANVTTVKANHAYLTAASGARFLGFDEETAINAIDALTNGKAQIFDLNGRQLNRLQKGINIVNGVKILVK